MGECDSSVPMPPSDPLFLPVRLPLLGHDSVEAFPCAFEPRIDLECGTEIVKRLGLLANGLNGLARARVKATASFRLSPSASVKSLPSDTRQG
jgi:hypothetical protein